MLTLSRSLLLVCLLSSSHAFAQKFDSQHVMVVEDGSGKVVIEKNADQMVPIASLTKLMTAMVVLDSHPDMDEKITIEKQDVDMLKHSASHLPVGSTLPRRDVLQLALMSSDNRAAFALARNYPGGLPAFIKAVNAKIIALGMTHTKIQEPTGLSPNNVSSASDLVRLATAASHYPAITDVTTDTDEQVNIKGRRVMFHNTNQLVDKKGWEILLSKTGFTTEAGNCLIMQIKLARKKFYMVLLNARARSTRVNDAFNIRRFLQTKVVE